MKWLVVAGCIWQLASVAVAQPCGKDNLLQGVVKVGAIGEQGSLK